MTISTGLISDYRDHLARLKEARQGWNDAKASGNRRAMEAADANLNFWSTSVVKLGNRLSSDELKSMGMEAWHE